jgi:beta-galactosidase
MQAAARRSHTPGTMLLTFAMLGSLLPSVWGFFVTPGQRLAPTSFTPPASHRVDTLLNTAPWKFHLGDVAGAQNPSFDDSSWTGIQLPHTWNNLDGQDGGSNYARGIGWYRAHYTVSSSYSGRRLYLQFDGADTITDVYVNGIHLGQHIGGYATFRFDATSALVIGGDNVIAVEVNNAYNADVAPLSADYTFFGGLYRSVHLVAVDTIHIRMTDYGSSGVFLNQTNVSASSANLQVTAETFNDGNAAQNVTLNSVIVDASNNVVQTLTSTQSLAAHGGYDFVQNTTIANPHLWDGRSNPYLYHVYVEVQTGSTVTDLVVQPLGFRFYHLDPNQGFFLNGHSLDLHGVNMHQDRQNEGWAISDAELDQDFSFVMEIGATAVRMAHYQHAQHIYDLADQNGIVIWAEIPLINSITNSTPRLSSGAFPTRSRSTPVPAPPRCSAS